MSSEDIANTNGAGASLEIHGRLPHRFPMLLVDRLCEVTSERAAGEKYVTVNEPFFRGHFPAAPVMPGVLVTEALFQLAWAAWGAEGGGFHLKGIRRLKFRQPVLAGDRIDLESQVLERTPEGMRVRCYARCCGKVMVEGELRLEFRKIPPKGSEESVEIEREPARA